MSITKYFNSWYLNYWKQRSSTLKPVSHSLISSRMQILRIKPSCDAHNLTPYTFFFKFGLDGTKINGGKWSLLLISCVCFWCFFLFQITKRRSLVFNVYFNLFIPTWMLWIHTLLGVLFIILLMFDIESCHIICIVS